MRYGLERLRRPAARILLSSSVLSLSQGPYHLAARESTEVTSHTTSNLLRANQQLDDSGMGRFEAAELGPDLLQAVVYAGNTEYRQPACRTKPIESFACAALHPAT